MLNTSVFRRIVRKTGGAAPAKAKVRRPIREGGGPQAGPPGESLQKEDHIDLSVKLPRDLKIIIKACFTGKWYRAHLNTLARPSGSFMCSANNPSYQKINFDSQTFQCINPLGRQLLYLVPAQLEQIMLVFVCMLKTSIFQRIIQKTKDRPPSVMRRPAAGRRSQRSERNPPPGSETNS
jgi:hypothetical protein